MYRQEIHRIVTTFALVVAALTGTFVVAGPAEAGTADRARATGARGGWSAPNAHGEPPQYKCTINASASAHTAWLRNPIRLGVLVTTQADIHNPYLFEGCRIKVTVLVFDSGGTEVSSVSNVAVAGSWFDPFGNNKAYTWRSEAVMDAEDLPNVASMSILLENVG